MDLLKPGMRLFFLSALLLASTSHAREIVGSVIPPYPEGWKDHGGTCITTGSSPDKICDFSIGVLKKAKQLILYLAKAEPRKDPREARWLVTDQMPYPSTPRGYQVLYGVCEMNGKQDDTIVAIAKITHTEWYGIVQLAYRANVNTGRFEKTPVQGIRCENVGWGT